MAIRVWEAWCPRCGAPWNYDERCYFCDYNQRGLPSRRETDLREESVDATPADEADTELEFGIDPDGEID